MSAEIGALLKQRDKEFTSVALMGVKTAETHWGPFFGGASPHLISLRFEVDSSRTSNGKITWIQITLYLLLSGVSFLTFTKTRGTPMSPVP